MQEQQTGSTTRVKERSREQETIKDDLHLKKEMGKLGVVLLYLLGIVIGGLSLSAMIGGLIKFIQ